MTYYMFEEQALPAEFRLPQLYIHLLSQPILPDLDPWWLLAENKKLTIGWNNTIRTLYPERALLPFAKRDGSDDVACFDLLDTTGDPKVYYIHAYALPGWENRGMAESFEEWLRKAQIESEEYKAEQDAS